MSKEHTLSPMLKREKHVAYGFGSNNPKTESKRKWRMAVPMGDSKQEIGDKQLNESPDYVNASGVTLNWYASTSYAFGYLKGKFVISLKNSMHSEMGVNFKGSVRRAFTYPGRIWPEEKLISFWTYPKTRKHFDKVINDLNNALDINIWRERGWKVEVLKNKVTKKIEDGVEDLKDGMVQGAWSLPWNPSRKGAVLVSVKNYVGSEDVAEKDINKEHIKSPLLKGLS